MRTHGWGGDPPRSDEEARERIVVATMRCVDRVGVAKTSLSVVAEEVGVTRQTVYRYFPSTDELLSAVGMVAIEPFLGRIARHCAKIDDVPELIVEAVAFTIERLPKERYLALLLAAGRSDLITKYATSPSAMQFGRAVLRRFPVDWEAEGFVDTDFDELLEQMLRILQSFILDPGSPPRRPKQLRSYLRRWLGSAVSAVGQPG